MTLWKGADVDKRDVVRRGFCAYTYENKYTKYNVNFVGSAVVKGILVIQSVQRNATAQMQYFKRHFWTVGYGNGSVGPRDENTLQNHIRRQNILRQPHLAV